MDIFKRPEYGKWKDLVRMFTDPSHKNYYKYGGKGIQIEKSWLGKDGYKNFIRDLGLCNLEKFTIARINKNKGFIPGNCRWVELTPAIPNEYMVKKFIKKYNFNETIRKFILKNKIMYLKDIPGYKEFQDIQSKCYNSKDPEYYKFGKIGIKVCDEWRSKFVNFINDMGIKPGNNYIVDRIDKTKDFSKDNCFWKLDYGYLRNNNGYIMVKLKSK